MKLKITKNQLRGWIKEALNEMEDEESTEEPSHIDATDIEDNPFDIEDKEVKEGKLTEIKTIPSGEIQRRMRKSKYWKKVGLSFEREVGKKFRGKKVSEKALDKMLPDYIDGKEIHALFIGAWVRDQKEGKLSEGVSVSKRFTVKEVKTWMRTLEENRYKKTYNSDCRRVAWMVNNEGVELSEMPVSMSKKWSKAQYGRERYLAKEFIKSQKAEKKLRESIRNIIKGKLTEAKFAELYIKNDMGTKLKVSKIIKQMRLKIDKDYDVKALSARGGDQKFMILPKHRNKFLELLMKNNINVRG